MACPNGYIEVNGNCVYAFGNESGVGPDGTPLPDKQGGKFWQWLSDNLPEILIGVGSVWQASQGGNNQPSTSPGTQPVPSQQNQVPVWVWIMLAVAAIVILVLLLRGRTAQVLPA